MIFFPELVIKIIQTREKSWEKKKEISFLKKIVCEKGVLVFEWCAT